MCAAGEVFVPTTQPYLGYAMRDVANAFYFMFHVLFEVVGFESGIEKG